MVWLALQTPASATLPDGLAALFRPAVAPEAIQAQPLVLAAARAVPWVVVVRCPVPAEASATSGSEPCTRLYGATRRLDGTWGRLQALGASEPLYNARLMSACESGAEPVKAAGACVPAVLVLRQAGAAVEILDAVGTGWFGFKRLERAEAERFEWEAQARMWVAHRRGLVMDVPRLLRWQGGRFVDVSPQEQGWYQRNMPGAVDGAEASPETGLDVAAWRHLAGDSAGACHQLKQVSASSALSAEKAFIKPALVEALQEYRCSP